MGALIAGTVVVTLAVIAATVAIYFRRKQGKETALERGWATKGDLSRRQEKVLIAERESAAALLRQILSPVDDLSGEMTILRTRDRLEAERWLRQYNVSNTRRAIENS